MYSSREAGTTIRYPSIANLMVDSLDRVNPANTSAWDFSIQKINNLQNGFFSRIATTEVVLEWCAENISDELQNNVLELDISGTGINTFVGNVNLVLNPGFYTVEDLLNEICGVFNSQTGTTGASMSINQLLFPNTVFLDVSGAVVTALTDSDTWNNLEASIFPNNDSLIEIGQCADIRPYRYIDIVSPQITYAQDVKDSTTNTTARDVLCRWYFADDVPESLDGLGFPIYQGYAPFRRRRIFNPPKQIRWDSNLPVGNLTFQVYGNDNKLVDPLSSGEWLLTLQLSEN